MFDHASPETKKRSYHSPTRQRQAEETRHKMLKAARMLFLQRGYAGTTLEAIAEEAGVSSKTVIAAFSTKRGILAELLSPETFGQRYQELLAHLRADPDPYERVWLVARITRQVYEALAPEFDLLRGAGAVATELAEVAQTVEERRWSRQEQFIAFLTEHGLLRADLTPKQATDEIWALTSFDLYRCLIIERGWSAEQYEVWLVRILRQQLFSPEPFSQQP